MDKDLLNDKKYGTISLRAKNRHSLNKTLNKWTVKFKKTDLIKILGGKIPFGPVNNAYEIFNDSHIQQRETVAEIDHSGKRSRITIVTIGTLAIIEQIKAQIGRIVPVHQVNDLTMEGQPVERELALLKVNGKGDKRVEALRLADVFRANVVDSTLDCFTFELTGSPEKIDAFTDLMRPLGLSDLARTGVVALSRGN